jgi:hypothetical protein
MSAQIREAITKLGKVLGQDPKKGRSRNPSATARVAGGHAHEQSRSVEIID